MNKGFIILLPILMLASFLFMIAYSTHEELSNLRYAVLRHELYLDDYYRKQSCLNRAALYKSYDPDFLISC